MVTRRFHSWFCILALSLTANGALASDAHSKLMRMASKLAGTENFSVSLHMAYDSVQTSGQKIEFAEVREVQVSRPNHLRVDVHESDGDESRMLFDGKTLTLFSAAEMVYSVTDQPGDLDSALRIVISKLGVRVPLARMLLSTFPEEIDRLSTDVIFVERHTMGEQPTYHIAGRTNDVDYQVWVSDDGLPRRVVLTYTHALGQPQFRADFLNWNLAPEVSSDTFTFAPPKEAERIPTLLPPPATAASPK